MGASPTVLVSHKPPLGAASSFPASVSFRMATAAIALGSNVGDRRAHLAAAADAIAHLPHSSLLSLSDFIPTDPVGPVPQDEYLNAAALIETGLDPRGLLDALLSIEQSRGRDRARERRWGPRTLDLDLLLYDGRVIDEPGLTIPHPRLHERAFVLMPLAQIGPDLVVPTLGRTIRGLLAELKPTSRRPAPEVAR